MKNSAEPTNRTSTTLIARIVRLPRLTRIALTALFALALTLVITPIVDGFYINHFYDFSTRMAPALVSTVLGLVFYLVGWRLMIGYAGETPTPRRAILWYFTVGALCCALVIILVIYGAITGSME